MNEKDAGNYNNVNGVIWHSVIVSINHSDESAVVTLKLSPLGFWVYGFWIPLIFMIRIEFDEIFVVRLSENLILLFYIVGDVDVKNVVLSNEYWRVIDDEFLVKYLLSLS